jgi:hypothetical protein
MPVHLGDVQPVGEKSEIGCEFRRNFLGYGWELSGFGIE